MLRIGGRIPPGIEPGWRAGLDVLVRPVLRGLDLRMICSPGKRDRHDQAMHVALDRAHMERTTMPFIVAVPASIALLTIPMGPSDA
ncbi:MAG: hypothetical protein PVG25_09390 [Anaerolineae bacterium]